MTELILLRTGDSFTSHNSEPAY